MAASNDSTRTLKRRGILAAAGAVTAGIVAKQAAQPVAAAANMQIADTLATVTNSVAGESQLVGTSGFVAGHFALSADVSALSTSDAGGVLGRGAGSGAGVMGLMSDALYPGVAVIAGVYGSSANNAGVKGSSTNNTGVFGQSDNSSGVFGETGAVPGSGQAGVVAFGNGSGNFGVLGDGVGGDTGTRAVGVQGQGAQFGVVGKVNNSANSIAVYGLNQSTGANPTGVYGLSNGGTGVFGQTNATSQYGVLGTTTALNSTAIAGIANTNGSSAFSGGTTNPLAYAGVFQGNVVIQGRLVVSDPSYKSGALHHPDGSTRLVYCVESPESWIEDVGKGTLTTGKATITFDKDFAAVTHTDDYHVFLTEYGDHHALYVETQSTTGFTVLAKGDATASGRFSWKVMVKGKSSVKAERLGKFVMPNLSLPDPTKLKAPVTPTAAVPKKPEHV